MVDYILILTLTIYKHWRAELVNIAKQVEEYTFFYYFDLLPTASCSLHWPFLKEALETLAAL